jgi:hypothetical protein
MDSDSSIPPAKSAEDVPLAMGYCAVNVVVGDAATELELLDAIFVVLVAFKVELTNMPNTTIRITTIATRLATPIEIAPLAFVNARLLTRMSSALFQTT